MNLEELVPDLELCKLIPQGEFEDSVLGYHRYCIKDGKEYYEVVQRGNTHSLTDVQYPAPTLQEILADIPYGVCRHLHDQWRVDSLITFSTSAKYDPNPATAALKLWLEVKGIEYEN